MNFHNAWIQRLIHGRVVVSHTLHGLGTRQCRDEQHREKRGRSHSKSPLRPNIRQRTQMPTEEPEQRHSDAERAHADTDRSPTSRFSCRENERPDYTESKTRSGAEILRISGLAAPAKNLAAGPIWGE